MHSLKKQYEVAYVRLIEGKGSEDNVELIAFANQNNTTPAIFKKPRKFRNIKRKHAYHDLWLFNRSRSDLDIVIGVENVNQIFRHSANEDALGKYHLYVGIPVFCANRKMVGLLEIVGLDDTRFNCVTDEEIEEVANKFLVPYANIFLLLHKMEKALLAGSKPA